MKRWNDDGTIQAGPHTTPTTMCQSPRYIMEAADVDFGVLLWVGLREHQIPYWHGRGPGGSFPALLCVGPRPPSVLHFVRPAGERLLGAPVLMLGQISPLRICRPLPVSIPSPFPGARSGSGRAHAHATYRVQGSPSHFTLAWLMGGGMAGALCGAERGPGAGPNCVEDMECGSVT